MSLCPECLKRIPAWYETSGDRVHLVKDCPDHGTFRALAWRGEPSLASLEPAQNTHQSQSLPDGKSAGAVLLIAASARITASTPARLCLK